MDLVYTSNDETTNIGQRAMEGNAAQADDYKSKVDELFAIVDRITQHQWAEPFMQPVDVDRLKLHDYYQIIDRPMDFSTIKNQMEALDGAGYKHVREICTDLRLVFKNAMKYNDDKHDVHVKAKKLLDIFEEKWLKFLPKVTEEEDKRKQEEVEAQINMQLAQEAAHAKLTRDLSNELDDIDTHIDELREAVVTKCRHISTLEKRKLGVALSKLSPEDLTKALEIVAQNNLNFQANVDEVELDINAQSESTLWRLKFFVNDVLKGRSKNSSKDDNNHNNINKKNSTDAVNNQEKNIVSKRKREICDALAKTAKKQKKPS